MNIRRTVITGAAALALVAGGTAAGAVAFASSGTVYNGCVEGTSRTLEHVYTRSNPPPCPSGGFRATWNQAGQRGPQGPSGVVSMTQYSPSGAAPVTGTWAFLGSPPTLSFTSHNTAAEVTATVDEASADGTEAFGALGICYQASGGSVTPISSVFPDFTASANSFFAQSVSGDVGNLNAGSYQVGLCADGQSSNMENGDAEVTITLAQTASGVTYAGPKAGPAKQRGAQ